MTRSHRFTPEQVVAFLAGRLTQLRVPVKPTPPEGWNPVVGNYCPTKVRRNGEEYPGPEVFGASDEDFGVLSPFGKPGDTLWGKEKFCIGYSLGDGSYTALNYSNDFGRTVFYAATSPDAAGEAKKPWQPSSRMKQADSRIFATVRRVWVERVQEISRDDAIACGISVLPLQSANDKSAWWQSSPGKNQARSPVAAYRKQWEAKYGPDAWQSNGFVWACEIERNQPARMR